MTVDDHLSHLFRCTVNNCVFWTPLWDNVSLLFRTFKDQTINWLMSRKEVIRLIQNEKLMVSHRPVPSRLMEMCRHFVILPRRLICPSSWSRKRQSHWDPDNHRAAAWTDFQEKVLWINENWWLIGLIQVNPREANYSVFSAQHVTLKSKVFNIKMQLKTQLAFEFVIIGLYKTTRMQEARSLKLPAVVFSDSSLI